MNHGYFKYDLTCLFVYLSSPRNLLRHKYFTQQPSWPQIHTRATGIVRSNMVFIEPWVKRREVTYRQCRTNARNTQPFVTLSENHISNSRGLTRGPCWEVCADTSNLTSKSPKNWQGPFSYHKIKIKFSKWKKNRIKQAIITLNYFDELIWFRAASLARTLNNRTSSTFIIKLVVTIFLLLSSCQSKLKKVFVFPSPSSSQQSKRSRTVNLCFNSAGF